MTNTRDESGPGRRLDAARDWAPYEPDRQRPWNLRRAAHLFRRAGFGASWTSLQQALKDGPKRTIDRLLQPEGDIAGFNRAYDDYEETATGQGSESVEPLREWWLRRMIDTPHPLLEKMTLFWHSFFGATNAKVLKGIALVRHIQMLRTHALGFFPPLLNAVSQDLAVLVSNGALQSYKGKPNESFPRAFLDCYTVGPGNYTETDVRAIARAFAGWFVMRWQLRLNPYEVDGGSKTLFGQTGNWNKEDVVRLVLQQPAVARLLVRRLYRWLVSETEDPDDERLAPLTELLSKGYDFGRLVEVMLRSNLFFSPAAYRQRVKSPVEYALNIVKGLEGVVPTPPLGHVLADLGQALGVPPTVHGWEGGRAWINSFTLIGRAKLAEALLSGKPPFGGRLNPAAVARRHGHHTPATAMNLLVDLFLQGDVPASVRQALNDTVRETASGSDAPDAIRRVCQTLVTLPEFQLA